MSEEKKNEVLNKGKELDESELGAVNGAADCFCYVGGAGVSDENTGCGCVLGGSGKDSGNTCICIVGGGGQPGGSVLPTEEDIANVPKSIDV